MDFSGSIHDTEGLAHIRLDSSSDLINTCIDYAKRFVGTPYIWGGNNPLEGFDCSGFVQEILACVGMDPKGDQTSGMLYRHFREQGAVKTEPHPGALAFYGENNRIIHIAYCIDSQLVIEAGGGGRKTRTPEDAAQHGAYVRIRPAKRRKDYLVCLMPEYHA